MSARRNGSGTYAPCKCGSWPLPSDARAGRCVCRNYRPAPLRRRASGWRALALAALYPLRVIAQLTHRFPEEGSR